MDTLVYGCIFGKFLIVIMVGAEIFHEITPLSAEDCFIIINRKKQHFNYPVHVHPEYEINYIENGQGSQRIVGDSFEEIDDLELCMIGNEKLEHGWMDYNCKSDEIYEITIQFHNKLFIDSLLSKNQFLSISKLFEDSKKGISFSRETIIEVKDKIKELVTKENGFLSVIDLILILYTLSNDKSYRTLSNSTFQNDTDTSESRRIQKTIRYLQQHYKEELRLEDVASHIGMSEASFSRFIKKRTGKNFINYLTDLRLGYASRNLANTNMSIAEICFECGFNNISNFNRLFKKRKKTTPKEFRENYSKIRKLI